MIFAEGHYLSHLARYSLFTWQENAKSSQKVRYVVAKFVTSLTTKAFLLWRGAAGATRILQQKAVQVLSQNSKIKPTFSAILRLANHGVSGS